MVFNVGLFEKATANSQQGQLPLDFQNGIKKGDLHFVKELLAIGIGANKPLPNGELPLHFAVRENKPEIATLLLDFGADPEISDYQQLTAIDHAVLMQNETLLSLILAKKIGVEIEKVDEQLKYKSTEARLEALKNKLKLISRVNIEKLSPICKAAYLGDIEGLREGIEKINDRDKNGLTPLHYAILGKQEVAIEELCNMGAEVNETTAEGDTLLHFAALSGAPAIVEAVIEAGFEINPQNRAGETPLHWASGQEKLAIVETLVRRGADPTLQDNEGLSPLALIGANASRKDPLALTRSNMILFAVTTFSLLSKLAETQGWVRSDYAKLAVTAVTFAAALFKTGNVQDITFDKVLSQLLTLGLKTIPPISLYFSATKTYDLARITFQTFKSSWHNLGYRNWAIARNIVVHTTNTSYSSFKLYKSASKNYAFFQNLFSNAVKLLKGQFGEEKSEGLKANIPNSARVAFSKRYVAPLDQLPIVAQKAKAVFGANITEKMAAQDLERGALNQTDFAQEVLTSYQQVNTTAPLVDIVLSYNYTGDGVKATHSILVQPSQLRVCDATSGAHVFESAAALQKALKGHFSSLNNNSWVNVRAG